MKNRNYVTKEVISVSAVYDQNPWFISAYGDVEIATEHEDKVDYYPDGSGYPGYHFQEVSDIQSIFIEEVAHQNPVINWVLQNNARLPKWIQNKIKSHVESFVEPMLWEIFE